MFKGVHLRVLPGDKLMFGVVRFEPHSIVPTHQHPHEQIGIVLEGELELWIKEDRRTLREGDVYLIPQTSPTAPRRRTRSASCSTPSTR
ncbi:MAG: cupin domain-containing protein [Armatimonadetes bacterium]|nr:cupin domain-containing protein [Armatimonadota bacterium]